MKRTENRRVGLVPLGKVPEIVLKVIAANISGYFNFDSRILPSMEPPEHAFDEHRFQYDAGIILKALESIRFGDLEKVVAVLSADIFVPIFEYTFGEARQAGKFALVSLFRLDGNPSGATVPDALVYERAAKVALHELGHLFDLTHCPEPKCLMHFSGGLEDLDDTPLYLCRHCGVYLNYNIQPPRRTP